MEKRARLLRLFQALQAHHNRVELHVLQRMNGLPVEPSVAQLRSQGARLAAEVDAALQGAPAVRRAAVATAHSRPSNAATSAGPVQVVLRHAGAQQSLEHVARLLQTNAAAVDPQAAFWVLTRLLRHGRPDLVRQLGVLLQQAHARAPASHPVLDMASATLLVRATIADGDGPPLDERLGETLKLLRWIHAAPGLCMDTALHGAMLHALQMDLQKRPRSPALFAEAVAQIGSFLDALEADGLLLPVNLDNLAASTLAVLRKCAPRVAQEGQLDPQIAQSPREWQFVLAACGAQGRALDVMALVAANPQLLAAWDALHLTLAARLASTDAVDSAFSGVMLDEGLRRLCKSPDVRLATTLLVLAGRARNSKAVGELEEIVGEQWDPAFATALVQARLRCREPDSAAAWLERVPVSSAAGLAFDAIRVCAREDRASVLSGVLGNAAIGLNATLPVAILRACAADRVLRHLEKRLGCEAPPSNSQNTAETLAEALAQHLTLLQGVSGARPALGRLSEGVLRLLAGLAGTSSAADPLRDAGNLAWRVAFQRDGDDSRLAARLSRAFLEFLLALDDRAAAAEFLNSGLPSSIAGTTAAASLWGQLYRLDLDGSRQQSVSE